MEHCPTTHDDIRELVERGRRLDRRISRKLEDLQEAIDMAGKTAKELRELMTKERTVDGGIKVLLYDLKAKVDAAHGDKAEIDAAFAETEADLVEKAKWILENTGIPVPPIEPNPPGSSQADAQRRTDEQRRAAQGR